MSQSIQIILNSEKRAIKPECWAPAFRLILREFRGFRGQSYARTRVARTGPKFHGLGPEAQPGHARCIYHREWKSLESTNSHSHLRQAKKRPFVRAIGGLQRVCVTLP